VCVCEPRVISSPESEGGRGGEGNSGEADGDVGAGTSKMNRLVGGVAEVRPGKENEGREGEEGRGGEGEGRGEMLEWLCLRGYISPVKSHGSERL
jgi:hypothetical protein